MRQLDLTIWFTTALVFAVIAGILALALTFVGSSDILYLSLIFSFFLLGIQWYFGPSIVRMVSGAKEIKPNEYPELHEMVSDLAKKSGIPKPKICIVNKDSPNAFAFGRTQSSSYVAYHTGLLRILNTEELRAVTAHELGHIRNRDVAVITMASVLPVALYYIIYFGIGFGMGGDRDNRPNPIAGFVGGLIAQFIGQLVVLWLSRQRELFADTHAKETTHSPMHLARALVKISYGMSQSKEKINPNMKTFYISSGDPVSRRIISAFESGEKEQIKKILEEEDKKSGLTSFLSTHPKVSTRLRNLFS